MKQILNYKRNELRTSFAKRVAQGGFVGSVLAAGAAMAQEASDAASTAATAITGSKDGILTVQNAVIGVVVLMVVFAFIKMSVKK